MTFARAVAEAPRWMFLGILVYAPWAYGCTNLIAISILNQFSAALVVLWLIGCLWRRRWPSVPWLATIAISLLLLQGWWLAWNAHSVHFYRTWTTVSRVWDFPPFPDWPGAIDRHSAQGAMMNVTALLALFLFACDLMARPIWRKRVWLTMAITAMTVALGGTALKLGSPEVREWIWGSTVAASQTTFATYRYHGNAASFMSMGWALTLGLTLVAFNQRARHLARVGWLAAVLGILLGLAMNTSRAGWGLAAGLASLIGARFLWAWWRQEREDFDWKQGAIQTLVPLAAVVAIAVAVFASNWAERLTRLNSTVESLQERYPARVYHQMVKEMSLLGYGANCFRMVLPPYMEVFGFQDEKYGFWEHAHNDYYEYLANWGWGGLALWIVLIGGGFGLGLRDHLRAPVQWRSTQWVLGWCSCTAIMGVLIHALGDFPLEKASILLYFLTLVADGWARITAREIIPNLPASESE